MAKATIETIDDKKKWLDEKVPFKAIKDDGRYKDDIVVTLNGKNWQIQRGITVMIPRKVLFLLDDSERQMAESAMVNQKFENQYTAKQDNL